MPESSEKDALCGICPAGCWVRATLRDGALGDAPRKVPGTANDQ